MNDFEGTWLLVRRVLPDGSELKPPAVYGLFNIHNGFEQTLVFWSTAEGKLASLSQIDKIEATQGEFVATPVLTVLDDGSGNPPFYTIGGETKRAPIVRLGRGISYQHPTHPPFVEREGDKLTATVEGAFVDHWERVK